MHKTSVETDINTHWREKRKKGKKKKKARKGKKKNYLIPKSCY